MGNRRAVQLPPLSPKSEILVTDPADIFHRTRALIGEISAALLGAASRNIGIERARTCGDLRNMERNCAEMGLLLAQALAMQMVLAKQIEKETWEMEFKRRAEADVRGVNIGGRG